MRKRLVHISHIGADERFRRKNKLAMHKYTCNGFKSVKAETMNEAAEIFASRAAKRKYGRSAYCRTCTQQSYAQDMSIAEFSAFIGYSTGRNETSGNNISFTVRRA